MFGGILTKGKAYGEENPMLGAGALRLHTNGVEYNLLICLGYNDIDIRIKVTIATC